MILFRLTFLFSICFYTKVFSETFINTVSPPWGYVFNNWDGPPIDIINYIPPNATPNTPLLVVIPGAS